MEHGQVQQRRRHQRHLLRRQPGAAHGQSSAAQLDRHRRRPHRRLRPDELHAQRRVRDVRSDHLRSVPDRHQRHRAIRTRPARPRRRWHSDRSRDNAVRPDRAGHSGGGQAYCNEYGETLLDGWGRRRGMAVRPRHPARDPAAAVGARSPTTAGTTPTSRHPTSSASAATGSTARRTCGPARTACWTTRTRPTTSTR